MSRTDRPADTRDDPGNGGGPTMMEMIVDALNTPEAQERRRAREEAEADGGGAGRAVSYTDSDGGLRINELADDVIRIHHLCWTRDGSADPSVGQQTIRYYDGRIYRPVESNPRTGYSTLRTFVLDLAGDMGRQKSTAVIARIQDRVFALPPVEEPTGLVPFANGLVDVAMAEEGMGALTPYSPEAFVTSEPLPYDWAPEPYAEGEEWYRSLVDPDDAEACTAALHEHMGACLHPVASAESKLLVLFGSHNNGKGLLLGIWRDCLGPGSVSGSKMQHISKDPEGFSVANLEGKRMNADGDMSGRDFRLLPGFVNGLITGDWVTASRKYGQMRSFQQTAAFVVATNDMPEIPNEARGAVRRRMVIVPMPHVFPESAPFAERMHADRRLHEWVLWQGVLAEKRVFIDGARRTRPASGDALLSAAEAASDPVSQFAEWYVDRCREEGVIGEDAPAGLAFHMGSAEDVHIEYRQYCADHGYLALGRDKFLDRMFGRDGDGIVQMVERRHEVVMGKHHRRVLWYHGPMSAGLAFRTGSLRAPLSFSSSRGLIPGGRALGHGPMMPRTGARRPAGRGRRTEADGQEGACRGPRFRRIRIMHVCIHQCHNPTPWKQSDAPRCRDGSQTCSGEGWGGLNPYCAGILKIF